MINLMQLNSTLISTDYIKAMINPEIVKYTGARFKKWDIFELTNYINENLHSNTSKLLGIFDNNEHLGNVRIHSIDRNNETCELGILLFNPLIWGKGVGTEAMNITLGYIESNSIASRVLADYFEENIASARLFKKCGFSIEGKFVNHFKNSNGTFSNSIRVGKNLGERSDDKT
jgi:RimJ/RimL family protein N-acetyltransferase